MRKVLVATSIIMVAACGAVWADGVGSSFGALTSARADGMGHANLGASVGIADRTSVFGTFSYGLSTYTVGRLRLGLIDDTGIDTKLVFGTDFQWQFWSVGQGSRDPFDMAVGGLFEFFSTDPFSVVQVGAHLTGSYPFAMRNGSVLSPYGRFNVRMESVNFDNPVIDDDSDLRFGLNGGVKWEITRTVDMYGEFQIDGNDGFFFGMDFNLQ